MKISDRRSPKGLRVSPPVTGLEWTERGYPDLPCFLADGRSLVFHRPDGPKVCHLCTDATGLRFAVDTFPVFDGEVEN